MEGIAKCLPTKFLKKCMKCYRYTMRAEPYQPHIDFYYVCVDNKYKGFIKEPKHESNN